MAMAADKVLAAELAAAVDLHRRGELTEAERVYRRVLRVDPDHPDALHLWGLVAHQNGESQMAVERIGRAIVARPREGLFHNNLGAALLDGGQADQAAGCFRRALALRPNYADALLNLARAAERQGEPEVAVDCLRRYLRLAPNNSTVRLQLAESLSSIGRHEEALAHYDTLIEADPHSADAHINRGLCLHQQGRTEDAIDSFRRAVECGPDRAEGHGNLGAALLAQGSLDEALACFQQALNIDPDYAQARFNRGLARLQKGDWQQGWADYEARRRLRGVNVRDFPQPTWDGSPLQGKTILLHAEQGLGDTLQFIRYAPLVKQRGGSVCFLAPRRLVPLLNAKVSRTLPVSATLEPATRSTVCSGIDRLISDDDDLPPFDLHAPLLSLPGIFGTTPETVPADVPYLAANAELVATWRRRLESIDGFRVGINWQGDPNNRIDRARSIPLVEFTPLAEVPGVRLVSLQKGPGLEQLESVQPPSVPETSSLRDTTTRRAQRFEVIDLGDDFDETAGPFMDTAAVMNALDLVITSDTSIAHLAGGLGVPVWVALSFVPEWRWRTPPRTARRVVGSSDRDDSPWYPTMRLFRQPAPGDWPAVFRAIQSALAEQVSG